MPSTFPTALDNFNNPSASAGDYLDTPGVLHDEQHSNANDAIEAIESLLGITGSTAAGSYEYRLSKANTLVAPTSLIVPFTLRGAASQSANLQEWQNSASALMGYVTSTGGAYFAGSVGIGITSPTDALQVGGYIQYNTATTGMGGLKDNDNHCIRSNGSGAQVFANNWNNVHGWIFRDQANSVDRVTIQGTGNVGLGTSSPVSKLHVHLGDVIIGAAAGGVQDLIFREDTTNLMGLRYQGGTAGNPLDVFNFQTATSLLRVLDSGRVGIGVAAPTAKLHLAAGAAAASGAPMKLTTGTALSVPEDGAIEYHGSHLWFTTGSSRFQLDQQGAAFTSFVSITKWGTD